MKRRRWYLTRMCGLPSLYGGTPVRGIYDFMQAMPARWHRAAFSRPCKARRAPKNEYAFGIYTAVKKVLTLMMKPLPIQSGARPVTSIVYSSSLNLR